MSRHFSLPKLRLRYQGQTEAHAETTSHNTPQSPSDRSNTTISPTPGVSLGICRLPLHLGQTAQDDPSGKQRCHTIGGTALSVTGRSCPFFSGNEVPETDPPSQ